MKKMFFGSVEVTTGSITKNVVLFTVPIIFTSLLQLMFNAADFIVVGRFAGSYCMGAIGATAPMINFLVGFVMNISVGAGVCVAHAYGAKDNDVLRKSVSTAIPLAAVLGVSATAIGLPLAGLFLNLTGTPETLFDMAQTYLRIYFTGAVFNLVFNYGAAILRSVGNTIAPFCYLTAAGVLNVLLNLFFVIILRMTVSGVALATVISQAFSSVLVIRALGKRTDACRFSFRSMRIYPDVLKKMLRIGIPAGAQCSLFSLSNVIIQSSVNSFGAVVVSGCAAASNIEAFVWVMMNAFYQTSMVCMGQNIGAKKFDRARKTTNVCAFCVTTVGIVFGGLVYLFSHNLLGIYIVDSENAIAFGTLRIALVCLPYFILGLNDVISGALRGMGLSATPMIISVFGICVFRIVWIYTVFSVPQFHSLYWLFISYPISWTVTFSANFILYLKARKKYLTPKNLTPAFRKTSI